MITLFYLMIIHLNLVYFWLAREEVTLYLFIHFFIVILMAYFLIHIFRFPKLMGNE